MRTPRHLLVLLLASAVMSLTGCEWMNLSDDPVPPPPAYARLSPTAPPADIAEEAERPENYRLEIWRPGYWSYDGGSFSWVSGELVARPSPTAVWARDRWERHDYGWAYIAGHWQ